MFSFLATLVQDLHPIVVHFPVALFSSSFLLSLASRFWPKVRETEWHLLVLGTLAAPVAVITGLIAHVPYERSNLATIIEPHQFSALLGTLVMIAFAVWRYTTRRQGNDIAARNVYLILALVGLVWIFIVGGTGGQLVYNYAINVRHVNPVLP